MIYLKSLAVGLLAGVAAIAVQGVVFYRSWSISDGGFVAAETSSTNIYAAPVVIAAVTGTLVTWWRLRAENVRA